MNYRRFSLGLATSAAAIAVLGASIVPASAATTAVKISAGSAASGTALTLTAKTTTQVTFKDLTTNQTLTCTSATATASAKVGSGQSPTKIASITKSTWTTCTGPLGLKFVVTRNGTWYLNATDKTASNKTPGTITSVNATVDGGSNCKFPVTGSTAASYTNGSSTGTLAVASAATTATATLTIGTVTGGCFGIIKSGDKASFTATYSTSAQSPYNPVTVTAT